MSAATELNPYRLKLPEGIEFGTLYVDPPWPLDQENTINKRRRIHYDRMSYDEIAAIPVNLVTHENSHLWLWTTNTHLPMALKLVDHWGFTYKTMRTWVKSKVGLGWWLRSRTEHLIFAAKGTDFRANPGTFTTELKGRWRGHSVKPVEAYEAIEMLSPGPRLELFSRDAEPRKGWYALQSHSVPTDPFGQGHKHPNTVPDTNDGKVRGVGGLEIIEGEKYVRLVKTLKAVPVIALEQKGRRVRIEIEGQKKWVTIDSLRPKGHKV